MPRPQVWILLLPLILSPRPGAADVRHCLLDELQFIIEPRLTREQAHRDRILAFLESPELARVDLPEELARRYAIAWTYGLDHPERMASIDRLVARASSGPPDSGHRSLLSELEKFLVHARESLREDLLNPRTSRARDADQVTEYTAELFRIRGMPFRERRVRVSDDRPERLALVFDQGGDAPYAKATRSLARRFPGTDVVYSPALLHDAMGRHVGGGAFLENLRLIAVDESFLEDFPRAISYRHEAMHLRLRERWRSGERNAFQTSMMVPAHETQYYSEEIATRARDLRELTGELRRAGSAGSTALIGSIAGHAYNAGSFSHATGRSVELALPVLEQAIESIARQGKFAQRLSRLADRWRKSRFRFGRSAWGDPILKIDVVAGKPGSPIPATVWVHLPPGTEIKARYAKEELLGLLRLAHWNLQESGRISRLASDAFGSLYELSVSERIRTPQGAMEAVEITRRLRLQLIEALR